MGRPPDPDYVRVLKGKKPKIGADQQLAFSIKLPDPPSWLKGEALASWKRMSLELHRVGILHEISRDNLARYCQAWADYSKMVEEENLLTRVKRRVTEWNLNEFKYRRQVRKEAEATMCRFEIEYGLTPAAATKIRRPLGAPNAKTPEGELADFLEEGET